MTTVQNVGQRYFPAHIPAGCLTLVVIGHSFISRLFNTALSLIPIIVFCFISREMTTDDQTAGKFGHFMTFAAQQDIYFLQMGSNDLFDIVMPVENIANVKLGFQHLYAKHGGCYFPQHFYVLSIIADAIFLNISRACQLWWMQ